MVRIVQGNKLYLAPLDGTPKRVLDVGTGTGIWAIEMVINHFLGGRGEGNFESLIS